MLSELEKKEKMYENYIAEHLMNVSTAFTIYGDKLCKALKVNPLELGQLVIAHDRLKYSDAEFDAYRNYFYPCINEEKNEEVFNKAWEHHYRNNPHHPQYWDGKDMEPLYIAEMLLDWQAMAIKFGSSNVEYYKKERDKKGFSENTKKILDVVVEEVFGK